MDRTRPPIGLMATFVMAALCSGTTVQAQWMDPGDPTLATRMAVEDNQFSWYGGPSKPQEWGRNFGAANRIRMKGYQDITALKFDLSSFRGRSVKDAELHLARADSAAIFAMVVSTINSDWQEGRRWGQDAKTGEPCWRWRQVPVDEAAPAAKDEWTFSHSDFSTAAFGNFGSLVAYGYKASDSFGTYHVDGQQWIRMKLPPDIVHALILDHFGLAVTDPRGYKHDNPRVYTKDQNARLAPRLLIQFDEAVDTRPPEAVPALTTEAGSHDGELILSFEAPVDLEAEKAFGYNVWVSPSDDPDAEDPVDRWRIPRPAIPGTAQRMVIEDLVPGVTYQCSVQAYDAAGNCGPVAEVACQLPPTQSEPALLEVENHRPEPETLSIKEVPNVLRYWACPETTKVNPRTGNRMADGYAGNGSDDYKKSNTIWNAEANCVALTASRNEMIGFQLILERLQDRLTNVTVQLDDFTGPDGSRIPTGLCAEAFRLHYVTKDDRTFPDAAIPLQAPFAQAFDLPDPVHNPKGVNQSVWVDLYIPKAVTPGPYRANLSISAEQVEAPIVIAVTIEISPIQIPDTLSFVIDMNGYGNPWAYGNDSLTRLRWFQTFHKHRVSLNTLPYGWNATVRSGRAPEISGSGAAVHVSDWTQFDGAYGPVFDGTAFLPIRSDSAYYGPGMGTPVATFYTPFFESWPLHVLDPKVGFDAQGRGGDYWNALIDTDPDAFWTDAPDVMDAMTPQYRQGVTNLVTEWMEHAEAKGWHQTHFQIYLNHKYSYRNCDALWILEECTTADDFRAVRFFHSLYQQGAAQADAPNVRWHRRIDISDKWGQHYGQLDNCINWVVINGGSSDWHWPNLRYRNILNEQPEQWVWYGTGPAPQDAGIEHAQRFLQAWAQGLDGGLPYWDNFQTSWHQANALSTVYSGRNVPGHGMYPGPVMSIRVKMMRQAQQIVELANLLAQQDGWNRRRVTQALLERYGDGRWQRSFTRLTEENLHHLRQDLMATLASCLAGH